MSQEYKVRTPASVILYVCDRRACENCDDDCVYTADITHAKNFELIGDIFAEKTVKETDESVVKDLLYGLYKGLTK